MAKWVTYLIILIIILPIVGYNITIVVGQHDIYGIEVIDTGAQKYAWIRSPRISMLVELVGKPSVNIITLNTGEKTVSIPIKRTYEMWQIELLNGTVLGSRQFRLENFSINENELTIYYSHMRRDVKVKITFLSNESGIFTFLEVKSSKGIPLHHVSYIVLGGIQAIGREAIDDHLVVPIQMGLEIHDPLRNLPEKGYSAPYPSPLSMQFLVFYDSDAGIYYGVHDKLSYYKVLKISPYTYDSQLLKLWWDFYPEKLGTTTQMKTPTIMLTSFRGGDWRCGASIYARWARDQWYTLRGTIEERYNNTWIMDLRAWWVHILPEDLDNFNVSREVDNILRANELLFNETSDNPLYGTVVDIWNWNKGGFDNDYPEFVPSRIGDTNMKQLVNELHSYGAKVTLYLNARLVDVDTDTYEKLLGSLPRTRSGELYIEEYGGILVAAVAHPGDEKYREVIVNQTLYVLSTYHIDIVFYDQVAVGAPVIDYGNSSVSLLAGDAWQRGYVELMREVEEKSGRDLYFAVEGVSEVYIPYVDFYWLTQTLDVRFPGNATIVQLFSFVYGDYVIITNLEPDARSPSGYYHYIISTNPSQGYIPRLTTHVVYRDNEKLDILRSIIEEESYLRSLGLYSSSRFAGVCDVINYHPKYIVVVGIAKSREGDIIEKNIWKPSLDLLIIKNDSKYMIFIYKYNSSVEVEYNDSFTKIIETPSFILLETTHYPNYSINRNSVGGPMEVYTLSMPDNYTSVTPHSEITINPETNWSQHELFILIAGLLIGLIAVMGRFRIRT